MSVTWSMTTAISACTNSPPMVCDGVSPASGTDAVGSNDTHP